jgi:hypothetical protein
MDCQHAMYYYHLHSCTVVSVACLAVHLGRYSTSLYLPSTQALYFEGALYRLLGDTIHPSDNLRCEVHGSYMRTDLGMGVILPIHRSEGLGHVTVVS